MRCAEEEYRQNVYAIRVFSPRRLIHSCGGTIEFSVQLLKHERTNRAEDRT